MAELVNDSRTQSLLSPPTGRWMSVDALRGFDMLWIVGAGGIVAALEKMSPSPLTAFMATQLKHAAWEGFRFYDLIFPLFLYIVGISIVFSLDKALSHQSRGQVIWRVIQRSLLLFALGIFYMGGLAKPWPDVALGGVLHRIAVCYLCGALIYIGIRRPLGLFVTSILLLVGYWGLVTFVPIPDIKLERSVIAQIAKDIGSDSPWAISASIKERVTGSYEEGRNLTNYLDFLFLPGQKKQVYYINEGLLSTLPAVALTLFGAITGLLLKATSIAPQRKIHWLLAAGIAGIAVGWIWSFQFPLIKRIWTSSFILIAGGWSMLLMAAFYWIIDVKAWRGWCQPFVWLGANALTIYLLFPLVGFTKIAERLVGGDIEIFFDTHVARGFGGLVIACVGLLLAILLMRFLYHRRIFLRV